MTILLPCLLLMAAQAVCCIATMGTGHIHCDGDDTLGIGQCSTPVRSNSISHKSSPFYIIDIISMLR